MAQVTSGLLTVFSWPPVYALAQNIMGGKRGRKYLVDQYIRPYPNMTVLDIGCGPAAILAHMPGVAYWGFDISEPYIEMAKKQFKEQGTFLVKEFEENDLNFLPRFDVVLLSGVLHHLSDNEVDNLLGLIALALKPDGRVVTVDPAFAPKQNFVAGWLIQHDRGRNVRDANGYRERAMKQFGDVRVEIKHRMWIPYTHCYMDCRKAWAQ